MGRRVRGSEPPGGSLDQRAKGDLVPMLLEQIAKQLFEGGLVGWQGVNLDDRAIGIGDTFRARLGSHLRFPPSLTAPGPATSKATRNPAKTPSPGRKKPIGS